jgi:polar amino acid transport system substrate-binding protein
MLRHAFAALSLLVLPVAANAADDLKLVEAGKLTWGSSPTFRPFEFYIDSKPAGFDVDMMDALAKHIGLASNLMSMEFKGVIPALLGGRVDVAVSGIYMTAERQKVANFVPYAIVGNQIVVPKGNPKHITGRDGLCGFKVAVAVSTAFEQAAKKVSDECVAKGKPALDLLSLPGSTNASVALAQGRADAVLNATSTIAAMMSESPDAYELAGPTFDANTKIGIALRKDSEALKAKLDEAMQAIVKDGTYAMLIKKWKLPPATAAY